MYGQIERANFNILVEVGDLIFNILRFLAYLDLHVSQLESWLGCEETVLEDFMKMSSSNDLGAIVESDKMAVCSTC